MLFGDKERQKADSGHHDGCVVDKDKFFHTLNSRPKNFTTGDS